ncbi:alpha/beta fold hydrolase [Mesorhizobium sp. M0976]|uniref:alpha/beta fold hydrolase n=1 Tax=unclassified Mesorhizobium TaxID=325217 RepID=UPI00333C5A0F
MATADWPLPERFTFQGNSIAWGAMGEGSPAVLLHGTPFSSSAWRRIAPLLGQQRRIYCFDMLGYGRSDKPDSDVSRGIQNELFAIIGACVPPMSSRMISAAQQRYAVICSMGSTIGRWC